MTLRSPRVVVIALLVVTAMGVSLAPSAPAADAPPTVAASKASSGKVVWLCRPGLRSDPCEMPLRTTDLGAKPGHRVSTPARPASKRRPVDCFYVYPTVSNQLTPNATKARDPEIVSIAKYQAARFSSLCRMYAPMYRQVTLSGIATGLLVGGFDKAYADVLQAWRAYLRHDNHGRGFVLIGHSQGSMMLRRLIHEQIDTHPRLRRRLVSAVIMGGNVTVRKGRTTGGDFRHVPVCTRGHQPGCVVAYSTYSTDPTISFFGNTNTDILTPQIGLESGAGYQVACTDPGRLLGHNRTVGVTVPSEPFAPGPISVGITYSALGQVPTAKTPWVTSSQRYRGSCRTIHGSTVFRYDPVGDAFRPMEFPPTWGTHLFDMNLGYDRLVRIVRLQRAAWLRRH